MNRPNSSTASSNSSTASSNTGDNTRKDPKDWVTGDEPMTGAQRAYLKTLSQETGQEVPENLTKGQASEKIEELKKIDPRVSASK